MSTNIVTLIGSLGDAPELRYTTGGRGVASFRLAVNRRYQQNNEWVEQVSWFNVVCWGDLGENAAATLTKGTRAIVTGRLEQRQYETKDGDKRSVVEVVADEVGPSLRWATAQVERTERSEGFSGGGASGGGGTRKRSDPIYGDDEEPFIRPAVTA